MAKALPLGGSPGSCKNIMSLHACQYIKCYFLTTATCTGHVREFRGATLPSAIWLRIERLDTREAYGEERVVLVGMSGRFLLIFVYTQRGESVRIISARKVMRRREILLSLECAVTAQSCGSGRTAARKGCRSRRRRQ
jgi:uncharacterized DUF497 family protein